MVQLAASASAPALMAARPTRTPTYGARRHPVSTRSVHGERLEGLGRLEGVERLGQPEAVAIPTAASSQQLLPSRRRLSPVEEFLAVETGGEPGLGPPARRGGPNPSYRLCPHSRLSRRSLKPPESLAAARRVSPLHHAMPQSRKLKPSPYLKQLLSSEDPTLSVGPAPLQPVHRRLDTHTVQGYLGVPVAQLWVPRK